jgi:hypothetical protein
MLSKKILVITIFLSAFSITHASGEISQIKNEPLEHIYEIPTKKLLKESLRISRIFLAEQYEDSTKVIKFIDETEGLIVGKATENWFLVMGNMSVRCQSSYSINIQANNNLVILKLNLENRAPSTSRCKGWDLPTQDGYKIIVESFNSFAVKLAKNLQDNSTPTITKK